MNPDRPASDTIPRPFRTVAKIAAIFALLYLLLTALPVLYDRFTREPHRLLTSVGWIVAYPVLGVGFGLLPSKSQQRFYSAFVPVAAVCTVAGLVFLFRENLTGLRWISRAGGLGLLALSLAAILGWTRYLRAQK